MPNAAAQARQTAGARHERTLSAVACSRLFGAGLAHDLHLGPRAPHPAGLAPLCPPLASTAPLGVPAKATPLTEEPGEALYAPEDLRGASHTLPRVCATGHVVGYPRPA